MVDTGNLRRLGCTSGVVVVVVAVVEGAILDVVSRLAALEACVISLTIIHERALVVESFAGISFLLGLTPSIRRCRGTVAGLPCAGF